MRADREKYVGLAALVFSKFENNTEIKTEATGSIAAKFTFELVGTKLRIESVVH